MSSCPVSRTAAPPPEVRSRARGCLLGQLAGDALGSQVEFLDPGEIQQLHPTGLRDLHDGETWDTIAGQPTDDSEMALALARCLVRHRRYDARLVRSAYCAWLESGPFDCGRTVRRGLTGAPDPESQANGALMRISPLGIFGAFVPAETLASWARADAHLTHPHPVCVEANALFACTLARAIATGPIPESLYADLLARSRAPKVPAPVQQAVLDARTAPPPSFLHQGGWVLIAFQNAIYQLLHASTPEEAIVDTVMRGGDTDTNAAICGALLGAVHGVEALPGRWIQTVLQCRPDAARAGVHQPRPRVYWPVDALELADALVLGPASTGTV